MRTPSRLLGKQTGASGKPAASRATFVAVVLLALCAVAAPAQTIVTVAGNGQMAFSGDGGPAGAAALNHPFGIVIDHGGNLVIADLDNNRVRRVSPQGFITTIAGTGAAGFSGDGGPATSAQLNQPSGLAIDNAGNLFIADAANRRVRKIASNGIITTVAGTGVEGFSGDGGPATSAQLRRPVALAVDGGGNLYIADSAGHRIRRVGTNGVITTYAGNGTPGFSGDGGSATSASLQTPTGVSFDPSGNLYVADADNHRIRLVRPGGSQIYTIAGNGQGGFSGDGGAPTSASFNFPYGVVAAGGALFVADASNNRIRRVTNVITTVAGTGLDGFSGDGGSPTSAQLNFPWAVAADPIGNIFIADRVNNRVRKIVYATQATPSLPANAVVNGASFRRATDPGGAIAAGTIVSIFGQSLAPGTAVASATPLPTALLGTTVTFNGIKAPLFFVSPTQINAQVPVELVTGSAMVQVQSNGMISANQPVTVAGVSPGIFTVNQNGLGAGAILHSTTGAPVNTSNPARKDEFVSIFAAGFGATNPTVPSGQPAASNGDLSRTGGMPLVTVGGVNAEVSFSGLAPGFVGLYQINVRIPAAAASGAQNVAISMNGVTANIVTIQIQ